MDGAAEGLEEGLKQVGADWRRFYDNGVGEWANAPAFTVKTEIDTGAREARLFVRAVLDDKGRIWNYVNYGTGKFGKSGREYEIKPTKPGGSLRFVTGYNPRTGVGGNFGVGSGKADGSVVIVKGVMHPGIKGRRFDVRYAEDNKRKIARTINDAIRAKTRRIR